MSYQKFMDHYCRVTRIPLTYNPLAHDSDIYLFQKKFSEEDLTKVAKHIRTRYEEKPEIMLSMLKFSYLIRQLDTFGELLAEAQAMSHRNRKPSERDKTLMATGRPAEAVAETPARSAGEVLRRMTPEQLADGWAAVRAALEAPPEEAEQPVNHHGYPYNPQVRAHDPEPSAVNNYLIEIEEQQVPPPEEGKT